MSNRMEHIVIGFALCAGAYALIKHASGEPIDWVRAGAWGCVGAGVAMLPDILEPAVSPLHRGIVHSAAMGAAVMYGTKKVLETPEIGNEGKAAATGLSAAFLSHLMADALTPAGIPLGV